MNSAPPPSENSVVGRLKNGRSLLKEEGGAVYVEYTVLLVVVSLIGAITSVSMGVPLLQTFHYAQLLLALPVP